jgi:FkbM family methyltransferase
MEMFVSYAQNFEDVMLNRVFGSVIDGFYIDIGACHPEIHSVTKHFYDKGWSGINIEPSKSNFEVLQKHRKRDTNLNVAVGRCAGDQEFIEVKSSSAMSSLRDSATSAYLNGLASRHYRVPVVTLQSICDQYCRAKPISFIKIDVEGSEADVIASLDWQTYRPILVVVEAIHPDTRLPAWGSWEPHLLEAGYLFVWYDGLNRYYLRNESEELKKHFLVQPSLIDGFVITSDHSLCLPLRTRVRLAAREILPSEVYGFLAKIYDSYKRLVLRAHFARGRAN